MPHTQRTEAEVEEMWPQVKTFQQPPEAGRGKKESYLELQGGWPCLHLDFGTVHQYVSVVLSHPVCGALLQQPQETNKMLIRNSTSGVEGSLR